MTKLTDFDKKLTIPMFGYASATDYYSTSCITGKISQVTVPLVCVNAADDPFSPQHCELVIHVHCMLYCIMAQCAGYSRHDL